MSDLLPGSGIVNQVVVVVAAFSVLVFVHELGHYLAARLTGVRVERFFVGFDIFGLAVKKEYKGTVYGIGILPLGGYCALAGQNDDPRKEVRTGKPDELQSKPLWARGLVFGGGVIMNFIFGFLVLVAAYMHGIPFIPPILGTLDPAGPAAVHGFQSGDRILRVDGRAVSSFEDAAEAIALSGAGGELEVEFERPLTSGGAETRTVRVRGRGSNMRGNLNSIGAEPQRSRVVAGIVDDPQFAGMMAGKLEIGDEILAVDGKELPENNGQLLQSLLSRSPGLKIPLTVRSGRDGGVREVRVPLETYGEWDIGLKIGVVVSGVASGGPADRSGLRAGDVIVAYQRAGDRLPKRLSSTGEFVAMIGAAALRPVRVDIARKGEDSFSVEAAPVPARGIQAAEAAPDTLLGVDGTMDGDDGFRIDAVLAGSPLEGKVRPGDCITGIDSKPLRRVKSLGEAVEDAAAMSIRLFVSRRPAEGEIAAPARRDIPDANLSLLISPRLNPEYRRPMIGIDVAAGPVVAVEPGSFAETSLGGAAVLTGARLAALQFSPHLGAAVFRFVFPGDSPYGGGLKTFVAGIPDFIRDDPAAAGFRSRLPVMLKTAETVEPLSFVPALAAAGGKWVDLSLMVYRVIHKLIVRTLPLDAVGGPVQLFRIIKIADDRGFAYFLYIVALISVNLGVCNLLPFPVLDGGHLVFLLIEWAMGRPPPRAVREAAQWVGLVCLMALMLTITGYDLLHLFRGTG